MYADVSATGYFPCCILPCRECYSTAEASRFRLGTGKAAFLLPLPLSTCDSKPSNTSVVSQHLSRQTVRRYHSCRPRTEITYTTLHQTNVGARAVTDQEQTAVVDPSPWSSDVRQHQFHVPRMNGDTEPGGKGATRFPPCPCHALSFLL